MKKLDVYTAPEAEVVECQLDAVILSDSPGTGEDGRYSGEIGGNNQ